MSNSHIHLKEIIIFSFVTVLLTSTMFITTFANTADAQPQPYRHNVAVALQNKDLLTTLRVGNDGAVYVQSFGLLNSCWKGPLPISQPNFAPAGAGIAMAKQTKDQLTAITVGNNGALHAFWVVGVGKWEGPVPISPPNIFPPGAPVAMAEQMPNQLSALVVGKNGGLHVSWVVGTGKWAGPDPIGPPNLFRPGAGVSMAKQTNNILSALAVTNNGALHLSYVVGNGKWNGPVPVSQPNFAPPGATTAMYKQTGNTLTGLTVGNNGALHVSWVVGTGKWNGPVPVSIPNFAPPGAGIGMARNFGNLIAMVVGVDGLLYRSSVVEGQKWTDPVPIDGTEYWSGRTNIEGLKKYPLFTPGAPVAMAEQRPDIAAYPIAFAVGSNGALYHTFFTERVNPPTGGYPVPYSYYPSEIEIHPTKKYARDDNKDGVPECRTWGDQFLILADPPD